MLAQISPNVVVAVMAIVASVLLALVGAVWRNGTKTGEVHTTLVDHERRITNCETHENEHDRWHLAQMRQR